MRWLALIPPWWWTLAASIWLCACGPSGSTPPGETVAIDGGGGPALVLDTDVFDVAPGDEVLMCTVTDVVLAAPLEVETIHGYQGKGGHHAALFYTTEPLAPHGTRLCDEGESMRWQLVGAGAEGETVGLRLPPGVAMRIPAGARLAIESHYVNAGRAVMTVRDRVTVESFGARQPIAFAGNFQVTDLALAIPPRSVQTRVVACTVDGDLDVVDLDGHAHQWARHVSVELVRAGSPEATMLYDLAWDPAFQFHPPTVGFPLESPLHLSKGDRVLVTCTWENTTDRTLRFPSEMCIASMHYVPDRGYLRCGDAVATLGG